MIGIISQSETNLAGLDRITVHINEVTKPFQDQRVHYSSSYSYHPSFPPSRRETHSLHYVCLQKAISLSLSNHHDPNPVIRIKRLPKQR
ncbi:hypothetical protein VTL71DRAFT_651 [Oculimacula yallundae]|uniref:Uncharacterized protein n=1 Tax=Oculimacula yallundae TaxID=86028 RepID=A0ABR4D0M6_9HELO